VVVPRGSEAGAPAIPALVTSLGRRATRGLRHATRTIHGAYDLIAAVNDRWRYDAAFPTFLHYDLGWQVFTTQDEDRREAARMAIALARGMDLAGEMANYHQHKHRAAEVADLVRTVGQQMGIADIDKEVDWVVEQLLCSADLVNLEARAEELLSNRRSATP
jgi:hypothetical protein